MDALSMAAEMSKKVAEGYSKEAAREAVELAAKNVLNEVAKGTIKAAVQSTAGAATQGMTQAAVRQTTATGVGAAATATAAANLSQTGTAAATTATAQNAAANAGQQVAKQTTWGWIKSGLWWGAKHPIKAGAAGVGLAVTGTALTATTQLAPEGSFINETGDYVLRKEGEMIVGAGSALAAGMFEAGKGAIGIEEPSASAVVAPTPEQAALAKLGLNTTTTNQTTQGIRPNSLIDNFLSLLPEEAKGFVSGILQSGWGKALLGLAILMGGGSLVKTIAPALGPGLGSVVSAVSSFGAPALGIFLMLPAVMGLFKGEAPSSTPDLSGLTTTAPSQDKIVEAPAKGKEPEVERSPKVTLGKLPQGGKVVTQVENDATLPAPTIGGIPSLARKL